jgi:hypothetical protein
MSEKTCNARLFGYERTSGGTPVPVVCTRLFGHEGKHSDQRDGNPMEWNLSGPAKLVEGVRAARPAQKSSRQFQIQLIEDAVAEIINHPLTPLLDDGANIRFKNIILKHLARLV